jgi:hypothetical protein
MNCLDTALDIFFPILSTDYFGITAAVLLKMLERLFVIALMCHLSDFGCS